MGDILHIVRGIKEGVEKEESKNAFLEWLASSISYRRLKNISEFVSTDNVMARLKRMSSNPDRYPTQKLVEQLYTTEVNTGTAPEMFAIIKIVKERFGIKD